MYYIARYFGLPLLMKELIEQSARKRTYILRTIYSVILYSTALWAFRQQFGPWDTLGFSVLGQGRTIYRSLGLLEFAGIYLFLPAMTCGVLTSEKERDTLGLLLLTKLGPWTIVFEKLFSRLVPMLSFALLSLPLLAVAYSLGGVESVDIAKLMWLLFVTAFQVGSFAVLCSAWFRTTAGAFVATYLLGGIAIIASIVVCQFAYHPLFNFCFQFVLTRPAYDWLFARPGMSVMPALILNGGELFEGLFSVNLNEQTLLDCVLMTLPALLSSGISLTLARFVLWRRAFIQPRNLLLSMFRALDSFFHRANQNRFTQGIVLVHESVALPFYHPVSWRETSKRSMGTTRYLIRMLLLLEIPVLFVSVYSLSMSSDRSGFDPTSITEWSLWLVATLVLTIQSTGLIGIERSRQTLDVLLTTPIESREIIHQKFAGIWRTIYMLWIPFTTAYLFQMWWHSFIRFGMGYNNYGPNNLPFYVLRAVCGVTLYLPTIAWLGFHIGLRCRSQTQAVLIAICFILGVCTVPAAIDWFIRPPFNPYQFNQFPQTWSSVIGWLSPAVVMTSEPQGIVDGFMLLLHLAGVVGLLIWLRSRAEKDFVKRVGRNDGTPFAEEIELPLMSLSRDDRMSRIRAGRIGVRANDE